MRIKNIAVCVKQVPNTEAVVSVDPATGSVQYNEFDCIMNPYDENAIEEAIRMKESRRNEPCVTLLSIGSGGIEEILRTGLAMGADRAVILETEERLDGYRKASLLAHLVKDAAPDVIFCGKRSIDTSSEQVPQMLAELLDLPHVTLVEKVEPNDEAGDAIVVCRKLPDGEKEIVEVAVPALISVEKGNAPRYPTLPDIIKARKKEILRLPPRVPERERSGTTIEKIAYRPAVYNKTPKLIDPDTNALSEVIELMKAEARTSAR